MIYKVGDIDELPNECGIYIGEIDLPSKDWYGKVVVHGNSTGEVISLVNRITEGLNNTEVEPAQPNYAAAFNMWMDQYVNDPQSFETSYDSAMRHVSEKLGGHEPSYGEVAAEQFKQYLNQLEKQQ